MKAIVIHAAKDLRIEEREAETPGPGQLSVKLATGGICGSDLHYFNHGGFGAIRLKEPMILGHEVAGTIEALGDNVSGLAIGLTLVAIHIVGIQVTGVSVNPARSLGPAIWVGLPALMQLWLFVAAPMVGAGLAGWAFRVRLLTADEA